MNYRITLGEFYILSGDKVQLVFHTSNGTPFTDEFVVQRKLYPILDALGIPRAGLHAFRHGNETLMDQMRVQRGTHEPHGTCGHAHDAQLQPRSQSR